MPNETGGPSPATSGAGATGTAATMKAVVQDGYGHADVLRLDMVPRPVAGDHDVLVRVAAAGLDRGVWHAMTGLPYLGPRLLRAASTQEPGTGVAFTKGSAAPFRRPAAAGTLGRLWSGCLAPQDGSGGSANQSRQHPVCRLLQLLTGCGDGA